MFTIVPRFGTALGLRFTMILIWESPPSPGCPFDGVIENGTPAFLVV